MTNPEEDLLATDLPNSLFSSRLADIPSLFKPQTICNCCFIVRNSRMVLGSFP